MEPAAWEARGAAAARGRRRAGAAAAPPPRTRPRGGLFERVWSQGGLQGRVGAHTAANQCQALELEKRDGVSGPEAALERDNRDGPPGGALERAKRDGPQAAHSGARDATGPQAARAALALAAALLAVAARGDGPGPGPAPGSGSVSAGREPDTCPAPAPQHEHCPGGVDAVYTWVDGADPWHREAASAGVPALARALGVEHRFRDFGAASTLRYSLRSLARHAPWLRRVWVVTAGPSQRPRWLRVAASPGEPGVHLVHHASIFPPEAIAQGALPTFNSCAIELNLHRIPGLAECFLYLNDDVLLLRALELPRDLWAPGSDEPFAQSNFQIAPFSAKGQPAWGVKLASVARELRLRTGLPREQVLLVGHHGHFMRRSVVEELVGQHGAFRHAAERTRLERWRTDHSLWLPMVYANWAFAKRAAERKRVHALYVELRDGGAGEGGRGEAGEDRGPAAAVRAAVAQLRSPEGRKFQWLCLNDELRGWSAALEHELRDLLDDLLPGPSPFELPS